MQQLSLVIVCCCVVAISHGAPAATPDSIRDMHLDITMEMPGMAQQHTDMEDNGHTMGSGHHHGQGGADDATLDPGHHHGQGGAENTTHDPDHDPEHMGHDPETVAHGGGHTAYFYFSLDSVILFRDWITDDWQTLTGSCIGLGVLAILYEGLKTFRETLLRRQIISRQNKSKWSMVCNCGHFTQSFLHILQVTVSYGLMLVFMTFNVWLCLSVVVGAGIGYFLFGWKRVTVVDGGEHCH